MKAARERAGRAGGRDGSGGGGSKNGISDKTGWKMTVRCSEARRMRVWGGGEKRRDAALADEERLQEGK